MTSRRVLVVDDDEAIREIAAVSMRAVGGHDVQTAASGAEALLLAAAQPPEVILLDVMMPELDGPTTALRLQDDERSRGIPVILLTAKVQARETARLGRVQGVRGIIAKPFDPMTLPQQVDEILGW
jgi:two-component system alkaline phosphatase synthesis response regulator PhoP